MGELVDRIVAYSKQVDDQEDVQNIPASFKDGLKIPIDQLSRESLSRILADIELIIETGRSLYEIEKENRSNAINLKASRAAQLVGKTLDSKPEDRLSSVLSDKKKKASKLRNMAGNFFWSNIRPEMIAEFYTDFENTETIKDNLFEPIVRAEEAQCVNTANAIEAIKKIHENIDMNHVKDTLITLKKHDGIEAKFSYEDGLFVYANFRNDKNIKHLAATFGDEAWMIDKIMEALPEMYKETVRNLHEYYDTRQYPRVNMVFTREHGVDMPKEDNYFPLLSLDVETENPILEDLKMRYSTLPGSINKGFTVSRSDSGAGFKSFNYFGTIVRNARDAEHYVAYSQAIRDVNEFMRNKALKNVMIHKSEKAYKEIKNWIQAVAKGRIVNNTNTLDEVSEFLRTNYVTSVLGGNIISVLKQPTAYFMGLAQVSKIEAGKALLDYWRSPFDYNKFIDEKSVMMRDRAKSVMRELSEIAEKDFGKFEFKGKPIYKKVKDASMVPMEVFDKVTANALWLAKYREVLNKGLDEDKAIREADAVIRQTQNMGGLVYLPSAFRAGGVTRMFTMFLNQANQTYNLLWRLKKTAKKQGLRKTVSELMYYLILPGIALHIIEQGFTPDDPIDDPESWIRSILNNATGGLPVFGQALDVAYATGGNWTRKLRGLKKDKGTWYLSDLQPAGFGGITSVMQGALRGKWEDIASGAATTMGVPGIVQMRRALKGVKEAVKTGDIRYYIWSKGALELKK